MRASSITLELSPIIQKQLKKIKRKDEKVFKLFRTRTKIFVADPFDPRLGTHKLKGRLLGRYAFSLTESLRVIFRFKTPTTILLIALGSHDQMYR